MNTMYVADDLAIVSKYEVIQAFFLTEEEENMSMAEELNKMINKFYAKERETKRNVTKLEFDVKSHKQTLEYIKKACLY